MYKETPTPIEQQPPAAERPKMTRAESFAMFKGDLKAVTSLDDQKFAMVAQFVHAIVENAKKPVDENGVNLITEATEVVLKNGDKNLILTLVGVNRAVVEGILVAKSNITSEKK